MWDLVGNPEDRFSHNKAQMINCVWERSSDGLNLKLPTEMAEIKVAKKTMFFPGKDRWSSPQIIPQGDFHIGQVLINKYG